MAPGSKSVFVGNIPFNLSEEQIKAILEQAGQVVKFRLMTNPDTGKPKGFGFADYADADSAASAVRNLNDYEVQGRKIRVDWPHNNEKDSVPQNYDQASTLPDGGLNGQLSATALPPLPPGVDLPPNLKATDAISQTLSALSPQQLLDVLTSMKSLAISEPEKTKEVLRQAPQLSYAIFQALILMNLVDPKILSQVIEQPSQSAPQAQAARPPIPQPILPVSQPPMIPPPQQIQQPNYGQVPPQQYPNYTHPGAGIPPRPPQPFGIPPPQQAYTQPPPQPQQPPQPQLTHEQMLQQVLAMDQRTIDSLPPNDRAQIMQIRQQMGVR